MIVKTKSIIFNLRRRSYDGLLADDDDETGLMYACDCGQEFINEQDLRRHQVFHKQYCEMILRHSLSVFF
jgi:hypothetical protein